MIGGLDGVLVVAKPPGPTSHDVVALVRRLSGTRRVGHGGTLDPFAAGVLPVFLGRATRLVEYHLGDRKRYRATICFGATSTTDDLDGELTPVTGPRVTREAVETALVAMLGTIEQRPPAYSALRVGGRRAYAMARAGETPVLPARSVTLDRLELIELGRDRSGATGGRRRGGLLAGHVRPGHRSRPGRSGWKRRLPGRADPDGQRPLSHRGRSHAR